MWLLTLKVVAVTVVRKLKIKTIVIQVASNAKKKTKKIFKKIQKPVSHKWLFKNADGLQYERNYQILKRVKKD